jgi:hypothetical protein
MRLSAVPWQASKNLPRGYTGGGRLIDDPHLTRTQMYHEIYRLKTTTPIDDLCADLPPVFAEFLYGARNLAFRVSLPLTAHYTCMHTHMH